MGPRALALWCALVVAAGARAAAYTVDCNHEYTDCDTELSKINEEDESLAHKTSIPETTTEEPTTPKSPKQTTLTTESSPVNKTETTVDDDSKSLKELEGIKPKPRLLNLNVDELQNFANALHNQSEFSNRKKPLGDLSDVHIEADDDDEPPRMVSLDIKHKEIPEKFYSNLQAPFHPSMNVDRTGSEEIDICRENEVTYKTGERLDRGCEETCECLPSGVFECSPRCKHPYIRRGRRLNDPLCFESPVDDCCSIVACATGSGDMKVAKVGLCKYGNDTFPVGATWHIGCEQTCACGDNSVVTCKPRCEPLPVSDKCINVQDPNDACCEVQVCDVSHDVHEEQENATSTTTTTTTSTTTEQSVKEQENNKQTQDLVSEPIGSVKVLQNNSVQVNLMHLNKSEDPIHLLLSNDGGKTYSDVELKHSNLILNLEGGKEYILKANESGTKFNFTITASDTGNEVPNENLNVTKVGCYQDGVFYAVGEEFHIGCSELCECTGPDTRECAALICPSHVGLELVSKGCVRWAPSPPATPPNCCPRSARCLSDGTCHYKGVPVPNWSEVPIALTGCEQRCFCENGDLDCQEVCSPLSPVPPQNFRCPPNHRPAAVNISDEDCCKQWGCLPNADYETNNTAYSIQFSPIKNYATPLPTTPTPIPILPSPLTQTESMDCYKNLASVVKTSPKDLKPNEQGTSTICKENITSFNTNDVNHAQEQSDYDNITPKEHKIEIPKMLDPFRKHLMGFNYNAHSNSHFSSEKHGHGSIKNKISDYVLKPFVHRTTQPTKPTTTIKQSPDPASKVPYKHNNTILFLPSSKRKETLYSNYKSLTTPTATKKPIKTGYKMFEPAAYQKPKASFNIPKIFLPRPIPQIQQLFRNHVTMLKTKDMTITAPSDIRKEVWDNDGNKYFTKNPYETVLLKAVPSAKLYKTTLPHSSYSTIDFEKFVNQMELESIINKNLERSTGPKDEDDEATGDASSDFPLPHELLIPTISPNIHFPLDELPGYTDNKKLSVITLVADSPTSVKMLFGLPHILVGLRGSVDLRYTDEDDEDITHWYSQVFAPADEVLTTPRLEFRLSGLKPSTLYKIRGKLYLHNLPMEPESDVYTIRTLDQPNEMPQEGKRREIDSRLTLIDVNDTAAHVSWRHFTEEELQFIDGIQVRYRPVGTPIYSMTELLHHSRTLAELFDLRPSHRYEASLVLVPPPKASSELTDPRVVEFKTAPYVDPYNWTVTIEARSVGSGAAELSWRGVPAPAERWVRVYRGAHACGPRQERDEFRLATRDSPPTITLTGLPAATKCRVWLELFLSNGKVKTSNVLEINTKSLDEPEPIDNEVESSSVRQQHHGGDYYGALVGVGAVAAIGALTSLLLLLVVVRRHRPRSVAITTVPSAPRESSLPPYDNPAYKLELQQETMDL